MKGELVRVEDLTAEAPHLVRLLERGCDDLPPALRRDAWNGLRHDLTRLKQRWQREAIEHQGGAA